jgi:hypothetical protein
MTTSSFFFVFANPVEGQEAEFNEWYDNTHVHEVCATPGISAAQRYTLAPMEIPENAIGTLPPPPHRYLAVYDVEGEPQQVMADFLGRLQGGEMTLSPALDFPNVSMGFWQPHGPRVTAS